MVTDIFVLFNILSDNSKGQQWLIFEMVINKKASKI